MLFTSVHYLVFLPVIAAVYFALPQTGRRYWLLAASFYFYAVFSIPLTLLLVYATALNYSAALIIDKSINHRRAALIIAIAGNLGMLFAFKYLDFFAANINAITGGEFMPLTHIILPLGISFYTFQAISYVVDVYRGTIKPERNILDIALYISYFPQLVAGPIMRAGDLIPQFKTRSSFDTARIFSGFLLLVWGLSKKLFIADPMGAIADQVYSAPETISGAALITGTYAFTVQIFADFSAYTDIAIGSSRILGISLMENFRLPYLATSLRDFWHRWHISLSTWLRDYLYIPLGGSRHGPARTAAAIMVTMVLGGLWHGASWTFLIWGALHGVFLIGEKLTPQGGTPKTKNEMRNWFFTFHVIGLGWIFFRAESLNGAFSVLKGIATWQDGTSVSIAPLLVLAALLGTQVLQTRVDVHGFFLRHAMLGRWLAYAALALCVVAMLGGRSPDFIYFQF